MDELMRIILLGVLECYGILFGGALLIAFIDYVVERIVKKLRKEEQNGRS